MPLRLTSPAALLLPALLLAAATAATADDHPAVLQNEFVFENPPFASSHASTIAETPNGLVVSYFAGTDEGEPDVGIWVSRQVDSAWTDPVEVANGVQADGTRHPCWNPVLFQVPDGPLLLFTKVGPSPSTWWGMLMRSDDGGVTWTEPERLPDGILGPIKNKPVLLEDGTLLCPSSTEDDGWRVHMESTRDLGQTWTRTEPMNDGATSGLIQPTVLIHPDNVLQLLCRSRDPAGRVVEFWSQDGGQTWSEPADTELPNPNSGVDAVTLADGRHLLIYNNTPRGRSPLNVATSADGRTWTPGPVLEDQPGEYSYPAVIQTSDGLVHVTYTWKRQLIKHVVLDPKAIEP